MKRLLYLAILSMMAMTIAAPAALAQQAGGLCPGAQVVTTFSGSASEGDKESPPFNITTDLFQVAVDNTSNDPAGDGSTSVDVYESDFGFVAGMNFGDGEDGIFNASNTGNGPFILETSSDLQSYDITVYECPADGEQTTTPPPPPPNGDDPNGGGTVTGTGGGGEGTTGGGEGTTGGGGTDQYENGDLPEVGNGGDDLPEVGNGGDDLPEVGNGGGSTGVPPGGMTELPDTGGPSVLLLGGSALLLGSGILGLAVLRRRFS